MGGNVPNAVAADADASVLGHGLPEECGGLVPSFIALDISYPLISYHFRNLGVGMHSRKAVLSLEERLKKGLMAEFMSQFQISLVS